MTVTMTIEEYEELKSYKKGYLKIRYSLTRLLCALPFVPVDLDVDKESGLFENGIRETALRYGINKGAW